MTEHTCTVCSMKLRPFKKTTDWSSRKMHKECYQKVKSHENMQYFVKLMIQREKDMAEIRRRVLNSR